MENNSFFDDKQNKAFANMRKGGQVLKTTKTDRKKLMTICKKREEYIIQENKIIKGAK